MLTELTEAMKESAAKAPLNFYQQDSLYMDAAAKKSDQADAAAEELHWDLEELLSN